MALSRTVITRKLVIFAAILNCTCISTETNGDFSQCEADVEIEEKKCSRNQIWYSAFHRHDLIASLDSWGFSDSRLLDNFEVELEERNYVRQVKNVLFSKVLPTPLQTTVKLVAVSSDLLENVLDLDKSISETEHFLTFVSGNTILPGSIPISHRYGGHQFGEWSDQLGDGRAHLLGEYVNRNGDRWELQLKGSGLTPYSRRGDGRAVLRSSIREFLCSEAMYHLGIPTSRALSVIVSGDPVWRDQFYDGHAKTEKAAVVLRLAKSWFRIGSLEILAMKREIKLLRRLTDFVIENYFPSIDISDENKYLSLFSEIVSQTADLMARWMSVGFAHGVMNTDNFSLLSITIDYGPFGFLDDYNPSFIPNTSDDEGMYSYENQPDIGHFNMNRLRAALWPLWNNKQKQLSEMILQGYIDIYKTRFMEIFRGKLGFLSTDDKDEYIIGLLLKMMEDTRTDFTMTFRQLGNLTFQHIQNNNVSDALWALKTLQLHEKWNNWLQLYYARITSEDDTDVKRMNRMNNVNPKYILRYWMAESAIRKAEDNDFSEVQKLLEILQAPYTEQLDMEPTGYADRPPEWSKKLKVSCSS
ncbi:protein nucleotidyltransferase YdiU-like [Saccoglossus kowalevskii]|uniref:Selenoprotein O n=1 Tax=Saccoglossus kowalevskii TaxID=10224 RepID=A0ABM0GNN1_SACKO|nr:PREDICTED: selenoprotein O-like [Saccoglossus kowalevskii]